MFIYSIEDIYCSAVFAPENGLLETSKFLTAKGYAWNTTLKFSCIDNFELIGPSSMKCDMKGQWSNTVPYCALPTIGIPPVNPITKSIIQKNEQGCYISQQIIDKTILLMINETINESYLEHGRKMNYSCFNSNQFTAHCSNGILIINQNCNEAQG